MYPRIDQAVHDTLREYLGYALLHQFNTVLPDQLDEICGGDVLSYRKTQWDVFDGEEPISIRELVLAGAHSLASYFHLSK